MDNQKIILIVDDEQDILNLYSTVLTQAGFQVVTALNGAEAVEVTKEKHPSLILMDVKMPVMDGVEAVLKLRKNPDTANTKIVFITAFDNPMIGLDIKIAEAIGEVSVVKKDISLAELVTRVKQYLTP